MKLLKQLALAALLILGISAPVAPVQAAQATCTMPITGPSTFGDFLNNSMNPCLAAILGNSSGGTAPAVTGQPATYQWWLDTSTNPDVLKIYDGASWLSIATVDVTGHLLGLTGNNLTITGTTVPTNGVNLPAANTLGLAVNSGNEVQLTGTAMSPAADGGSSLGTTALGWNDLFGDTGFVLNIENSDWVATHTAGILTVGTGDLRVTTAGTDTASVVTVGGTQTLTSKTLTSPTLTSPALGAATGSSLVLTGTGANILAAGRQGTTTPALNVDASAASSATGVNIAAAAAGSRALVSVLSSGTDEGLSIDAKGSGTVRIGATSTGAVEFSRNAVPTASDGAALGTTGLQWSDLFLASGGVLNWANGDAVLTHSAGILTVSTGDLRVTTAGTNSASAVTVGGTQTLTAKTLTTPVLNGTPTGTGVDTAATASTLALRDASANAAADAFLEGYTTTATAAGTTTLTVDSTQLQFFTGATTQTVQLPVTSTLVLGQSYTITNKSSGDVTINSSGGNAVQVVTAGNTAVVVCILTSGTSAASWHATYISSGAGTGTVTSVATGTGLSGGPITTTGTVSFSDSNVGTWAATPSSANLRSALSDETGTGVAMFATSPQVTTGLELDNASDTTLTRAGAGLLAVEGNNVQLSKGQTLFTLLPAGNEPPSSNQATWGVRNQHPYLAFTSGGSLAAVWTTTIPRSYSGNGLSVIVNYITASATTGTAQFQIAIEADAAGGQDLDSDGFATAQTDTAATVPGTTGIIGAFTIPISSGANMDSAAAGDTIRVKATRGTDTATGDLQIISIEVREAP